LPTTCFAEAHAAGIEHVIFIIHQQNLFTREFFESERASNFFADFPGLHVSFIETHERKGDGQLCCSPREHLEDDEAFAVTMGDFGPGCPVAPLSASWLRYITQPTYGTLVEDVRAKNCSNMVLSTHKRQNARLYRIRGIVEKAKTRRSTEHIA